MREIVITQEDVTARIRADEAIQRLPYHDPLTDLPNRFLFHNRLEQALASARHSGCYGALIFIDLDNFKHINDVYGHTTSDEVVKRIAQRLQALVRAEGVLARFGGDEFCILLSELSASRDTAVHHALRAGELIRASLVQPFTIDSRDYRLGASLGLTLFPKLNEDADDLIREADLAATPVADIFSVTRP